MRLVVGTWFLGTHLIAEQDFRCMGASERDTAQATPYCWERLRLPLVGMALAGIDRGDAHWPPEGREHYALR